MIKVLDQDTANKIAAGEVVERPASVVKELVENALDAKATEIAVEILGGGISFIRVRDNGVGINQEELPLALERHATSKIAKAEDLLNISSLGFRGEALPSIAAVSRMQISSCQEGKTGAQVRIEGGEFLGITPKAISRGTIVEVEDLFYNVPARRKFLRTENTESGRIQRLLEAMAIARPDVAFSFISDGKEVLKTQATGSMLLAINSVYGQKLAKELLEIQLDFGDYKVKGYVGKPDVARGRRDRQIFIINNRLVECKTVLAALEKAFYDVIPKNRYPIAFLDLAIPQEDIDVNVHPAKLVVRLSSETQVFSLVHRAVRDAVDKRLLEPASFMNPYGTKQSKHLPPEKSGSSMQKVIEWVEKRDDYPKEEVTEETTTKEFDQQRQNYQLPRKDSFEDVSLIKEQRQEYNLAYPKILGQVNKTYIIAEWEDCILLYDQHSAHERVLYEKYLLANENLPKTELLFPLPLELSPEEFASLERLREDLEVFGFEIADFGPSSLAITHVPVDVFGTEAEEVIREILLEKKGPHFREKASAILACRGAVKAGDILTEIEMRALILELNKCKTPSLCPHGRPTMLRLDWQELEKRFGRNR
ncbi:MAG TPA: DNA mismatch repair endonuclease MutL [Firmicutes bacterium]|nr:DNA mismatch repair endonuclease MutL [Bacillota bacterium]